MRIQVNKKRFLHKKLNFREDSNTIKKPKNTESYAKAYNFIVNVTKDKRRLIFQKVIMMLHKYVEMGI